MFSYSDTKLPGWQRLKLIAIACMVLLQFACSEDATDLLTAHTWRADRVWAQVGNNPLFYKRGNPSSTLKLDQESIRFFKNNTGILTDNHGIETPFSWRFTDSFHKKLETRVQFLPPVTKQWDIFSLKKDQLIYMEKYTQGTTSFMSYEERTPK